MNYTLRVSEPWGFKGLDGKNRIDGKLIVKSNDHAMFEIQYEISLNNAKGNVLVLHPRYDDEGFLDLNKLDSISVNAGICSGFNCDDLSIEEIDSQSVFSIIGRISALKVHL